MSIEFFVRGIIKEVETDAVVRGAFGSEAALNLKLEKVTGKDYTQSVMVPDTPANRAALKPGVEFHAPCVIEGGEYEGRGYIRVRSSYQAKG